MSDSDDLERNIGLVGAVSIGVGTMVAGGIFVLSGLAVANVGAAAVVSFLLAALVAGLTGLTYAEFASVYTVDGGGYEYVAETFDSDWSYFVGWMMILGYPASAAFYLASFSNWFARFVYPVLGIPPSVPYWVSGVVVLAVLVGVNRMGAEETGRFQVVVTVLKVLLVLLFLWGGLRAFRADVVADSMARNLPQVTDVALTGALVFITFFGFEAIATSEGEIRRPRKTVPWAIFLSLGIVTVLYALVVTVVVLAINDGGFLSYLAGRSDLASRSAARAFVARNGEVAMARAAGYYLGDVGFYVFVVGALLSMVSATNATILAGSRVKLAMARYGHLPDRFRDVDPGRNTPSHAVNLTGGLILLFVLGFGVVFGAGPEGTAVRGGLELGGIHLGLDALAHFADFLLLAGLTAVNAALIRSRRVHPDLERPFEVPGVPWIPGLAALSTLALLFNVELVSVGLALVALLVGGVVRATLLQ